VAEQPDYSGSAMLALYPPPELAARLAVPDGLDPDDMHVTVAYVGDAADVDPDALKAAAAALSARQPIRGVIAGHARFTGGDQDVIVALADSPGLESLRADALRVLASSDIAVPSEHGYTPHCTLRYLGQDDDDPVGRLPAEPVTFAAISAVHGGVRTDFPLALPDPAEAFAAGWAASGAALGERFDAGMRAAILAAGDCPGGHVTEATLKLGALTGTWATVYDRQDALYAARAADLTRIWRDLTAGLAVARMVDAFRRPALMQQDGPAPGSDHEDPQARQHRKRELRALALTAATGMLAGLPADDGYAGFLAVVAAAVTAAAGEGFAAALAVAAADAGHAGFDWDAAQKDGEHAPDSTETALVAGVLVSAMASRLAGVLTALAVAGATAEAMTEAVVTALHDAAALGLSLTHAMASAITTAVQALYAAHCVAKLDFVTVGDDWVCAVCDACEAANPHDADRFPPCPAHVGCRCWPAPAPGHALPSSAYAPYLTAAREAQ
jgi:2'-5' RNA ligase